jgi:pantetheine-phosphate adenylyltransferase
VSTRTGLYPGSFDPVTFGHVDIVRRAAHLVDKLVIAIGAHHDKHPLFSTKERVALAKDVLQPVADAVRLSLLVSTYDTLTVSAAKTAGASIIIRGLRDAGDFDYEVQMAGMNAALTPDIETVFLASSPGTRHIAASLVRQIVEMGGDVASFVPPVVAAALKKKFSGKSGA